MARKKIVSKDKQFEKEISKIEKIILERKRLGDLSEEEETKFEKEIQNLRMKIDRVLEQMKLKGIYGEGPVSDINDSAAIQLGPVKKGTPLYDSDDISPVSKSGLTEEEKRIDSLCLGLPLDKDVYYQTRNLKTKFKIHYMFPRDGGSRPGLKLKGTPYIICHETTTGLGYATADRTSERYESLMDKNNNEGKETGYHFLCDKDQIILFIPWDEIAYHASSRFYNPRSIGIERIVTEDAGMDAIYNQAKLVATLMYMYNIPINRLTTHLNSTISTPLKNKDGTLRTDERGELVYNPKSCPDRVINGKYGGEHVFKQVVVNCLRTGDLYVKELTLLKEQYEWFDTIYAAKPRLGHGR